MAERIQLKEPGSGYVMTVGSVRAETVEKNDYYLFSNGQKELLVPQSSIKAQLERLDLTDAQEMIGHTIRFGRSMKMSRANRPYWDIEFADANGVTTSAKSSGAENGSAGGDMGKPNAGTTSASPSAEFARPKMRDAYKDLTKWVIREIFPLYAAEFGECGPDIVAACTQTLFIQACKSGKVE